MKGATEVQLKISYQYRDAGNNKNYDEVILINPSMIAAEKIKKIVNTAFKEDQCFSDTLHFKPEIIGIPTLYFDSQDSFLDLGLHEIIEITATDEEATIEITVDEVIRLIHLIERKSNSLNNIHK